MEHQYRNWFAIYRVMLFPVTLSDLAKYSMTRSAASLRQLSFSFSITLNAFYTFESTTASNQTCARRAVTATLVSARHLSGGSITATTRTCETSTFVYCSTTACSEFCCSAGVDLRPRDRVTEALINLHWLPVPGRIELKLGVLLYKSLNGIAPSYIATTDSDASSTSHSPLCHEQRLARI